MYPNHPQVPFWANMSWNQILKNDQDSHLFGGNRTSPTTLNMNNMNKYGMRIA
jgi:hypothetical protein